jgi:hypothetical protein
MGIRVYELLPTLLPRRQTDHAGACGIEIGLASPLKDHGRMLDSQAGAEPFGPFSAIVHSELRAVPISEEVEVASIVAADERIAGSSPLKQAKIHQGTVGAPPSAIDRAAQVETLRYAP